ncbi:MAG TPA: CPBP family intramembrane glutamic endopeptidase, partial [Dehalococcoidia bacterium]|nr:CPBP family intramembrane glutamic endopeptidase [Dehalococcoidia bacterium]
FPSAQNTQCVAVQHEYGHFIALAIIVVCLIAPLSEETIFRGFIYGWLHRWLPIGLAVPVSGAIFAALHGVLLLFIPLMFVGCVLALIFQGSRSLWPGALVHALFNLPGIIAILSSPTC